MAIFRKIHVNFWRDPFVRKLTPEQKYFYLYLMTNEATTQAGIYEIDLSTMSHETGYNSETINKLLAFFEETGKVKYSRETDEVALKNWPKYNDSNSPKVRKCIAGELSKVKNRVLMQYLYSIDTQSQEEQEQEKEQEPDLIQTIWIKSFGRNPREPEREETEKQLNRFGYERTLQLYKDAVKSGVKIIRTLVEHTDSVGNFIPFEKSFNNQTNSCTTPAAHQYL